MGQLFVHAPQFLSISTKDPTWALGRGPMASRITGLRLLQDGRKGHSEGRFSLPAFLSTLEWMVSALFLTITVHTGSRDAPFNSNCCRISPLFFLSPSRTTATSIDSPILDNLFNYHDWRNIYNGCVFAGILNAIGIGHSTDRDGKRWKITKDTAIIMPPIPIPIFQEILQC
ncbi:hypothetical protein Ancab_002265 [Ancistrocladus abbreviatus]